MTANKIKTLNKLFFCLVIIIFFISCQDEKTYNLKTYIIPDNAGEILTESGVYAEGTKLILEALSKDNFTFTRWSGDIDSKTNPLNFEINSDLDIVAEFKEIIDASSKDSDNDGVSDSIDLCPSTPSGFLVDESRSKRRQG